MNWGCPSTVFIFLCQRVYLLSDQWHFLLDCFWCFRKKMFLIEGSQTEENGVLVKYLLFQKWATMVCHTIFLLNSVVKEEGLLSSLPMHCHFLASKWAIYTRTSSQPCKMLSFLAKAPPICWIFGMCCLPIYRLQLGRACQILAFYNRQIVVYSFTDSSMNYKGGHKAATEPESH